MQLTFTNNQTPPGDIIAKMHETINRLTAITSVVDIIILPIEKREEIIGQMFMAIPGRATYNGIDTVFVPACEVVQRATGERFRGKKVLFMAKNKDDEWCWFEGDAIKSGNRPIETLHEAMEGLKGI